MPMVQDHSGSETHILYLGLMGETQFTTFHCFGQWPFACSLPREVLELDCLLEDALDPLGQRFSTFLMLRPFNTVLRVMVTPPPRPHHKTVFVVTSFRLLL